MKRILPPLLVIMMMLSACFEADYALYDMHPAPPPEVIEVEVPVEVIVEVEVAVVFLSIVNVPAIVSSASFVI